MMSTVLLLLAFTIVCGVVATHTTQPGALEKYPPTSNGTFTVFVDNFSFDSPAKFTLRYFVYDSFASAWDAPVLLYFGNEGPIEGFYDATGAQFEAAETLNAFVVFVEHRYFGFSLPFGEASLNTREGLRYLTLEQTLADFSNFIDALPSILGCRSIGRHGSSRCDVVTYGGSYGGMLAAWHRLKYPQLTVGAIASGAPVDFWPGSDMLTVFRDAYINTFGTYGGQATGSSNGDESSPQCANAVREALHVTAAATAVDLEASGVHTCSSFDLDDSATEKLLFYVEGALSSIALVDYPYATNFIAPLPANPVKTACATLLTPSTDGEGSRGDVNVSLAMVMQTVSLLVNGTGDLKCFDLDMELVGTPTEPPVPHADPSQLRLINEGSTSGGSGDTRVSGGLGAPEMGTTAWNYLVCGEVVLEPITSDGFGFFPPADGVQTDELLRSCEARYGVQPRPNWLPRSFGDGGDLVSALSNVYFAENDKDPWHVGTTSIAHALARGGKNGTAGLVAGAGSVNNERGVYRRLARGGAHHQDLRFTSPLDSADVVDMRQEEVRVVRRWLDEVAIV